MATTIMNMLIESDDDECATCHGWKHYPRFCLEPWTSSLSCWWWPQSRNQWMLYMFRSDHTQAHSSSCWTVSAAIAAWTLRCHRSCQVRTPSRLVSCEDGTQFEPVRWERHNISVPFSLWPKTRLSSAWGYNRAALFLGDINTGTWSSRLGESKIWDSKIYCILHIVHCKRQTRPLVKEGAPYKKPAMFWQK
jgi:hypothetical protein